MEVELLTIGTELLLGFTIDTNASDIARALASIGARVVRQTTVGDDEAAIGDALREALARTGFVIATGGLGPTRDDVTKQAAARLFNAPLELDERYLEVLRQRFESLGRGPMPAANRSQAEVPRGAVVLKNRWGTAPGLWLEGPPGTVVLLPGVPREMRGLIEHEVVPRLGERMRQLGSPDVVTRSRTLRTTGISESALADRIGDLEDQLAPARLAYLPGFEGVDLRLTVWGLAAAAAEEALDRGAELLRPALGHHLYGEGDADLAAIVLDLLRQRRLSLAVAESCTGGLLSGRLTAVPGSSDVFVGGIVAYSNTIKTAQLGVPADVIASRGAVSEETVRAMARGVMAQLGARAGVAITGIAGPSGGTPEKPVGTVWIAAAVESQERAVQRRFPGDREDVRRRSAQAGLDLLRGLLTTA
ncbi:MAG TPA: competence/damage-inducible protein A [Gemmatimonadales bacterium]|nr:competence/damage-inducible protein A [Gemmatimonadales bacterium]